MEIPHKKDMLNSTYDYKKLIELQANETNKTTKKEKPKEKVKQNTKVKSRIIPKARRGV